MGKEILEHDPYVDYVKAIGIVFVVFSHVDNRADSFLFLFFMGIFFVASGYCYNGLKAWTWWLGSLCVETFKKAIFSICVLQYHTAFTAQFFCILSFDSNIWRLQ